MNTVPPSDVVILLISGTCCYPGLASVDAQAEQVIRQALTETGITGQVRTLLASSAIQGSIPADILEQLRVALQPPNLMRLPAVFIDGKLLCIGVPELDAVKTALQLSRHPTL
jgi:hypothetical protein